MRIPWHLHVGYAFGVFLGLALIAPRAAHPTEVVLNHRRFTIPDGTQLQLAADAAVTLRPICVDFDLAGRLYVAESSGSNDDVQTQLQQRPHQILRLVDADGDGVFDTRTVFADQMMLPEGTLWHAGSLYVAAPPVIWKLTDADDDGVAERREVWFDGQTLTGCANDLHGPYVGPDGWIYWCKGAFAEQTHVLTNGALFSTRAAHIFRRRPEGGPLEPVMTGGMDNPVELVFTPQGERIFSTTFLQHPAGGQRDGLIHAIYGGLYGKRHGVLDGHPATGDLLPAMTHLGAAAPCGLARLQSRALGFQDQLLTACFNLHKVTRHQLVPAGASFTTIDDDLVSSADLDFHPTDVIEDADGSVLVVDTGGWYKLCCPTSQLVKPDVHGAIYRLSRLDAPVVDDPQGRSVAWSQTSPEHLVGLLADARPAVRRRARQQLVNLGTDAVAWLVPKALAQDDTRSSIEAVWTLCQIPGEEARGALRSALSSSVEAVVQAATHAVSVSRDRQAVPQLVELLKGSPPTQRVAAEALGRLGDAQAIPHLLTAIQASSGDRILEHSLTFALIEIGDVATLKPALATDQAAALKAALVAIDQVNPQALAADEVCPLLSHRDAAVRDTATGICATHPAWSSAIVRQLNDFVRSDQALWQYPREQLVRLARLVPVQELLVDVLQSEVTAPAKVHIVEVLRASGSSASTWMSCVGQLLDSSDDELVSATIRLMATRPSQANNDADDVSQQLRRIAASPTFSHELRLQALQGAATLDAELFPWVLDRLAVDRPVPQRSLAASLIANAKLSPAQLQRLANRLEVVGPLELQKVLGVFGQQTDVQLGKELFTALQSNPALEALPQQQLEALARQFGPTIMKQAESVYRDVPNWSDQAQRLDNLLHQLPDGDVRRGQTLFHSDKLACFACHAVGYRGGDVGPDLTHIARVRSRSDLLEAILFPSRSFVRSYEPVMLVTNDGQTVGGTLRDQTDDYVLLQVSATEQRRVATSEIAEMLPGKVSIMPAGMEKLMTGQELADILAFLESRK